MMRFGFAVLAVLVLAVPPSAADGIDPHAPVLAIASTTGNAVAVSWVPGAEAPDYFNVYGMDNGTRTLLGTGVTANHAEVAWGFPSYEVTAVTGTTETAALVAVAFLTDICRVEVDDGPPPTVNAGGCTPGLPAKGHLEIDARTGLVE
ncbi:MAG: hypothetical protein QOE90_2417 [Thermoplasmata archaeon]|jgi:hypothetical protein|nr:hypothetical protein [Thermoplasmata archaeon]